MLKGRDKPVREWSFSTKHKASPYDDYEGGTQNIGAISSEGRKIIAYYHEENDSYEFVEYYNLKNDPKGTTNLIEHPDYQDELRHTQEVFEKEYELIIN